MSFFLLLGLTTLNVQSAQASHFRYGTISWSPTATAGEVQFNVKVGIRRSYVGAPNVGDAIGAPHDFFFGDGGVTYPNYTVTAIDTTTDFLVAEAIFNHTYATAGTYTAAFSSCCRLSNLQNRADGNWYGETTVTPFGANRSPVCTLVPTVVVQPSTAAPFTVAASDVDGDTLRFRLSTDAEAGGGASPPGLTVNSSTGEVTWDTTGLSTTNPYTAQFIVEDLDLNGIAKSKIPIDVILKVNNNGGVAPECEAHTTMANQPEHGPIVVVFGTPITFHVEGFDEDSGATVTLNTSGLPAGATMNPALPFTGASGVRSDFSWTPVQAQIGSYVISYSATDNTGLQSLTSMTINVINDNTIANSDNYVTPANQTLTVAPRGVLTNDTDVDNDPLTAILVSNPTHGTLNLNANGGFTYTPNAGFVGIDSFRYRANDGTASSNYAKVTIGVGAILDIDDAVVTEGDTGTTTLVFTVTRSGDSSGTSTVHFSTGGGSATAGSDYVAIPDTILTFLPTETTQTISVTVNGDAPFEADETVRVTLSNPSANSVIRTAAGVGTILNDDAIPVVSINNAAAVTEGDSGTTPSTFTVSLDHASSLPIRVQAATANGTAIAPGDYSTTITGVSSGDNIAQGKTATLSSTYSSNVASRAVDGVTSAGFNQSAGADYQSQPYLEVDLGSVQSLDHVTVWNLNDGNNYLNGFYVLVSDVPFTASGAGTLAASQAQAGVTSIGPHTLSTLSIDVPVNRTGRYIRIIRPTTDYLFLAEVQAIDLPGIRFAPGETSKDISVPVKGDTAFEDNETFTVNLSSPINATLGTASGTGTILNDDPVPPVVSISNAAAVTEGDSSTTPSTFTVSLDHASSLPITVQAATQDGTAIAPGDYSTSITGVGSGSNVAQGKTATQPSTYNGQGASLAVDGNTGGAFSQCAGVNNQLQPYIEVDLGSVQLLDHVTIWNTDGQGFRLNGFHVLVSDVAFTASGTGTLAASQAQAGVTDIVPSVTVTNSTVSIDVPVNRTGRYIRIITPNTDYLFLAEVQAFQSVVVFAPGETSKMISVPVKGDLLYEDDETFTVNLSSPTGATLGTASGTGTILNDDDVPSLIVTTTNDTVANGGGNSLREALAYANRLAGVDTIEFDLPANEKDSNSVWNITLGSPLTLDESVILTSPVTDSLVVNGNINLTTSTLTVAGARNITLNGAITDGAGTPGLLEGRITGNQFDETTLNPATAVQSGPRLGQTIAKPPWGDYETWVYSGQFYDADGIFSFAENIDDNVSVKIDGVLRLRNALDTSRNNSWHTATTTGSTTDDSGDTNANAYGGTTNFGMGPKGDGWHDIEIRMGNAGGGAGPYSGSGWGSNFGFGLSSSGSTSTLASNYVKPIDDGSGTLFRNSFTGVGQLIKQGAGTLTLSGANTISGGTTISAGQLVVASGATLGPVKLAGGTLAGSGTVGTLTSLTDGGTVAPGIAPGAGLLSTVGNVALNAATTYAVELNGNTPGNGAGKYDQLKVTGAINLNNATLAASSGFSPANNDSFTIVTSTTGLSGTFAGLPEAANLTISGRAFTIHYAANAVTLAVVPNTAPVANNQSVTTNQGVAKAITLTGSDVDNDPLSYAIATGPAHGTLTGSGANRTYKPANGFAGNDSFTFVANDGTVDSAPATVSITVIEAASLIVTTSQDITANDGFTSLREAIAYANRKVGADTILFAIPTPRGAGVQTIQLASALPTLSGSGAATTIDGYSQAGASANTLAVGSNAVILIEVRGNGVAAFDGLTIDAANCVVKGLSIGNCRYGINLESSEAHDTVISGNFIGLAANGSAASANDYGISIDHAANVTVGGATPAARNVIGANNAEGIVTTGDNGTISGNYIGTNAAASSARPNRSGVLISVGAGNTLSGNLISGNTQNGVAIYGSGASSAPNNIVRGNTIGLSSGGSALGNGIGVSILDASASIIGGVGGGQANIISGNSGKGVIVRGNLAAGSSVRGNAIYANGGLGIDLNDDGVSANDLGDGDSGPNGLQNFPVITALSSNGGGGIATNSIGGSSSISGTLNSTPNQSFSIDLYDNAAADASGYGQGQTYLGTTTANTDNNGNATFSATLNGVSLANGRVISATATDASGNSSEFSLARTFDSNNAPVASNGPANVDEDDSVQITLVASDADNNALTYSIVSNPAHGTLGAVVGNKVTYTPAANYNGSDSFTFKANDGKADSNVATVSITINIVSDAPVAVDDSYIAQAGKTLTVDAPGVLGNDTNVDDDIVTVGSYTQPANGSVTLNTDGSFVYTPDLGFHGTDSFTYRSTDSHLPSNAATVTIVVQLVQVSSFSPAGGAPGTEVTVNGQNFVGVDDVQLNGQSTAFTVISSRKLTFIVPAGATTGKISVLAGVDNVSSAKEFVVAPRNITFTPSSGVAADVITISGENLGDVRTTVKFSGATAPVNARVEMRSATTMTVVVPNTAVTGPISVSNIGGSASSASSFVVNPSISSFTPSAGGFKTLVKVNGKGLGGATAVLLNGVNVGSFTQVSATQVSFSVPAGATTGKITVMTPSGMAVSSQNFSVYPK